MHAPDFAAATAVDHANDPITGDETDAGAVGAYKGAGPCRAVLRLKPALEAMGWDVPNADPAVVVVSENESLIVAERGALDIAVFCQNGL
ncbi:MAG TPA: hypothetical protein VHC73_13570, partial [Vitreimonas sp.]|nr:hypothetical protein [Vitreimonas sp.]